jgi:hypothetical protein
MIHADFVADRSLVDVMAYAGWVLDHQDRRKETALFDECRKIAEYQLRSQYTHVFYLPIEFPIVLDGLRPDDPEFQQDIDRRIIKLLDTNDVAYEPLTGDVPTRVKALMERVSG